MSERNKKQISLGKKGLPEIVLSILKALGSCYPATAPLASMLSDFQNQKQYQLIEDTLNKFFAMIERLDERVRNIEYMNSQECICDLLRTVDYAKATVVGILWSNIAGTTFKLYPLSITDTTTGINGISSNEENNKDVVIYNLQGVRQNGLKKGINIVNGKKIIVR